MKCTWKIIHEEKGAKINTSDIQSLMIDNKVLTNQNKIAYIFNSYFLSIKDSINVDNNKHINSHMINPINYLANNFRRPFTKISCQSASTYKIEKIIKSLRTKNSCGYNEISNQIIKLSSHS
jgi:hypothetical protein